MCIVLYHVHNKHLQSSLVWLIWAFTTTPSLFLGIFVVLFWFGFLLILRFSQVHPVTLLSKRQSEWYIPEDLQIQECQSAAFTHKEKCVYDSWVITCGLKIDHMWLYCSMTFRSELWNLKSPLTLLSSHPGLDKTIFFVLQTKCC